MLHRRGILFRFPATGALLVLLLLVPASARAGPPNLDRQYALEFSGFAQLPAGVGDTLVLRSRLVQGAFQPPLPLDFTNLEHTLVLTGIVETQDVDVQRLVPAAFAVYSDAITGGTPADYAAPASWTDGDCILQGTFGALDRYVPTYPVDLYGFFLITGGSRRGELREFLSTFLAYETSAAPGPPPGYDVQMTGWLQGPVDAIRAATWTAVRELYRD